MATQGLYITPYYYANVTRIEVIAYSPTDFLEEKDVTVGRCRELVEKYQVTWVNVVDPDTRTMAQLETLFNLHPLALEDSTRTYAPPKVEQYEDHLFIIARTIVWEEEISTDQLSMFLSKQFLITIHDMVFPHLEDIRVKIRKKNPKLLKGGTDYLFYTIMDTIVDSYFPHIDRFSDVIENLEDEVIKNPTKTGIDRIHAIRTDLLMLRNSLAPQRDAISTMARADMPVFKKETRMYMRDVYDHMIRVLDSLGTYREVVTSLMEVQSTLVSNTLNEVIKVLTVIFTVTIPAAIITSAFGMNVGLPGRDDPLGLIIAIILITALTLVTIFYLRHKKWL